MATKFLTIYERALATFKSPSLCRLQGTDIIRFCEVMYYYLQFAITAYNPNVDVYDRISDQTAPIDDSNIFTCDGIQDEFELTGTVLPTDESYIEVFINDIATTDYTFSETLGTITFTEPPESGSSVYVVWYTDGQFNKVLTSEDITLLSLATCWGWAIQTSNNQLDIDRQPMDTDFKLSAEGTTTNAKTSWVKHYEEMFKRELNKADWRSTFRRYG